jgi:AraC-like DNA-binding protein
MDVLTDVLESIRARSLLLGRLDLTAPWGLSFDPKPEPALGFFVVTRGSAVFETADGDQRWLTGGDFVLACRPMAKVLRDHPDSPVVPASSIMKQCPDRQDCRPGGVFEHGGGGALTSVIGGRIEIENLMHNPLLRSLPAVIHVRGGHGTPASWLETTLQFISSEMHSGQPGASTVISRLVDVLLVQAIRTHLAQSPTTAGSWLRALVDPQIGRALSLIHEHPDSPWTVQQLAERVAMSRSAFSARFSDLVEEPPLTYLTRWRMARATRILQTTNQPLSEVAARVGYEADAAFSKAFKRWTGVAPGEFRRQQRTPADELLVPMGTGAR